MGSLAHECYVIVSRLLNPRYKYIVKTHLQLDIYQAVLRPASAILEGVLLPARGYWIIWLGVAP